MSELDLLLIRLDDLSKSSDNKQVKLIAEALHRYFKNSNKSELGFKAEK